MDSSLLATKLQIPPTTRGALLRSRLVDELERAIPDYKLILVSAPAGFGKTTLLSQWARLSRYAVAWVSLGEDENNPDRFLRYLLTAWDRVQPGIKERPVGLLLGSRAPDIDAVLSAFINAAADAPEHVVFVLDDFHLIHDTAVLRAISFILDHLPPSMHFAMTVRADPPLPLARLRARHEMLEIRSGELAFLQEETAEFLNGHMRLGLSPDEIAQVQRQLEGWAAGLQLAALTMQHGLRDANTLQVTGRSRYLADYLTEEVFAGLPGELSDFMLRSSILDRLCASLCARVTGVTGSQNVLERLERENLFLSPLDDRRAWYRYHAIFADFLREELRGRYPEEVDELQRRAAEWFLERELPDEAFHHALAANDAGQVVRILERFGNLKLHSGELKQVATWLDALPPAWESEYPVIGLIRAGLMAFTGHFDACIRGIETAEERLSHVAPDDARWQLAIVRSVRCFIACMQEDVTHAEEYAEQALRALREESISFRTGIYIALGDTYRRVGRWEDARASYQTVLRFDDWPGHRVQSAHVLGALADLELRQGRLRNAAGYWQKARAAIEHESTWGRLPLPATGWVFVRTGEILYEWNERAAAWEHLARGLERSELGGDIRAMIAGNVLAARVKQAEGVLAAAGEYLDRAGPLVERASFPEWTGHYERARVELMLAQGRLRAAVEWADPIARDNALPDGPDGEITRLALARVLIARGDVASRESALRMLDRLVLWSAMEGRVGVQIEARALLSLACWGGGDRAGALTALGGALRLAEPEGYLRLFVDLGQPMPTLLREARSRGVMPGYVDRLLAVFGAHAGLLPSSEPRGFEPLSPREHEILALIAAGLTNREIGERVFISPETVKKHSASIFAKLGVSNRTEAAARARDFGLLG